MTKKVSKELRERFERSVPGKKFVDPRLVSDTERQIDKHLAMQNFLRNQPGEGLLAME